MSQVKLLYLVHRLPYPPDKGDRIRAFHVLRFLADRAEVHLACLADEPVGSDVLPALREHAARVAIVPIGRWARWSQGLLSLARGRTATEGAFRRAGLRQIIRQWTSETRYAGVLASASSMTPYLRTPELEDVPAVVDLVDVDSQKWFDFAAASWGVKRWLYRLEGRRLRGLERGLPGWARAVTLVSEAEARLYRQFCAPGRVEAVGNGVNLEYFRPGSEATEPSCVFVGALDYHPNVEGVNWFCREVWPGVRAAQPRAKLLLVGRRPAPKVRWTARLPGVELVGQVPDVRPYLARAAVAVVPLRIARGVQNKVLEALAMAKAVIASPECLKGLHARPGVHLRAASTPSEWRRVVLELLRSLSLRQALGAAGRRFVEQHHRWDTCLAPLAAILGLPTSSPSSSPKAGRGSCRASSPCSISSLSSPREGEAPAEPDLAAVAQHAVAQSRVRLATKDGLD